MWDRKLLLHSLSRPKRSIMVQFITRILPLRIETGRFQHFNVEDRTHDVCTGMHIEGWKTLSLWLLYNNIREIFFEKFIPVSTSCNFLIIWNFLWPRIQFFSKLYIWSLEQRRKLYLRRTLRVPHTTDILIYFTCLLRTLLY